MTPGRLLAPPLLLALSVSLLTGCGLLDGGSRLEESLEYLPADTTALTFVDQAAIDQRLSSVSGEPSEAELTDYVEAQRDAPASSRLHPYLVVMVDEAAFHGLDVEWETDASFGEQGATVWKLDDDLDLDAVADDLADAGYEESGSDDVRVFATELAASDGGLFGGRYPPFLVTVAVIPDEHLVVASGATDPAIVEEVAAVATDDLESLADSGDLDDVVAETEDAEAVEFARLARGADACAPVGIERMSPEQRERLLGDLDGSSAPSASGVFVSGDEVPARAALLFDDDSAAEADAGIRAAYLGELTDRYRLEVEFDVRADGSTVLVEADPDHQREMVDMVHRGEGVIACAPGE